MYPREEIGYILKLFIVTVNLENIVKWIDYKNTNFYLKMVNSKL